MATVSPCIVLREPSVLLPSHPLYFAARRRFPAPKRPTPLSSASMAGGVHKIAAEIGAEGGSPRTSTTRPTLTHPHPTRGTPQLPVWNFAHAFPPCGTRAAPDCARNFPVLLTSVPPCAPVCPRVAGVLAPHWPRLVWPPRGPRAPTRSSPRGSPCTRRLRTRFHAFPPCGARAASDCARNAPVLLTRVPPCPVWLMCAAPPVRPTPAPRARHTGYSRGLFRN